MRRPTTTNDRRPPQLLPVARQSIGDQPTTERQPAGYLRPLARIASVGLATFTATLAVGMALSAPAIRAVDEAVFDLTTDALQSSSWLIEFCRVATDLGDPTINWAMALVAALLAVLDRRHALPGLLVIAMLATAHVLQRATDLIVDGSIPTNNVIGDAGPYFSGGTLRVMLLTGIIATHALPTQRPRTVWQLAAGFGTFQALTRLALGRHWPLDLLAAFPIGFSLLWTYHQLLALLSAPPTEAHHIELPTGSMPTRTSVQQRPDPACRNTDEPVLAAPTVTTGRRGATGANGHC